MEGLKRGPDGLAATELGRLEAPDDILKCGGAHEVFLLEPELSSLEEVIVGVQNTRDVLGVVAVENGLDVIAIVD